MKNIKLASMLLTGVAAMFININVNAQSSPSTELKYKIVDLSTGQQITVMYDTVQWRTFNTLTNQPVEYYVVVHETGMPDTVHGVTGIIVNNLIWRNPEGHWVFNEDKVKWDGNEFKMKDRYGRKVKWENGSLKIKDWNSKYKSEKGDGAKYKEEWDKIKWKDDEVKIERGTQKTKVNN
jgi:hypothetical protein